jgi:hypothetical protein
MHEGGAFGQHGKWRASQVQRLAGTRLALPAKLKRPGADVPSTRSPQRRGVIGVLRVRATNARKMRVAHAHCLPRFFFAPKASDGCLRSTNDTSSCMSRIPTRRVEDVRIKGSRRRNVCWEDEAIPAIATWEGPIFDLASLGNMQTAQIVDKGQQIIGFLTQIPTSS